MKTYLECIPCFNAQARRTVQISTQDEMVRRKALDEVSVTIAHLPFEVTPPEIAQQIYRTIARVTENGDPFCQAKKTFNEQALSFIPQLQQVLADSPDALLDACKLAIAGNVMDLAPQSSYGELGSILESALSSPLVIDHYSQFRQSLRKSSHILYLGDNAGEIVFDRLLIEQLHRLGEFDIHFVVRDQPIINDATLEDALACGLDEICTVISSGSDAPAIILSQCSSHVQQLFEAADLIISKGQGNYEALSEVQRNIFFFLKIKCDVVAKLLKSTSGGAVLKGKDCGPTDPS